MDELTTIANSPKPLPRFSKKSAGFSRNEIVEAFHRAFLMIGGVQRLTLWGNANPGEFYKLYSKLLPSTNVNIGDNNKVIIIHTLPKTALDVHDQPPAFEMTDLGPIPVDVEVVAVSNPT